MTNKEFMDTIIVTKELSDTTKYLIARLLKLNVDIQESIRLLLKLEIDIVLIIEVLFIFSMYCDYNKDRLNEFNRIVNNIQEREKLIDWLKKHIRQEKSNVYTLKYMLHISKEWIKD